MQVVEKFLKARSVCETLGISRATLYRKVVAGEIDQPVRNGVRMSRWPESSIVKYQERVKAMNQA